MRTKLMALTVTLLFLLQPISVVAAEGEQNELPWTPEIAKQLVALGWERGTALADEPIVVYTLSMLEVNGRFNSVLDTYLTGSKQSEGQAGWQLHFDETTIDMVTDYSMSLLARFDGWHEKAGASAGAESFLVTVGTNPVSVSLVEEWIAADRDEERTLSQLEISLRPRLIEHAQERVMTEISLAYQGTSGELARTEATSWVSRESERPLAIVSQRLDASDRSMRRYFALYLTTAVLPVDKLPHDAPIVTFGNLAGLQRMLYLEEEAKPSTQMELFVGEHSAQFIGQFAIAHTLPSGHHGYVLVEAAGDDLGYKLGLEPDIAEKLRWAAQLQDRPGKKRDPVLRLGLSDETTVRENLDLRIAYFPVQLELMDTELTTKSYGEVLVRLHPGQLELWYEGVYSDGEMKHAAGIGFMVTPQWGLKAFWREMGDDSSKVMLGLVHRR